MVQIGVLLPVSMQKAIFSETSRKEMEAIAAVRWNETDEQLTEEQACQFLQGCEVSVGSWKTPKPSRAILEACPEIKLWEHAAGSVKAFFSDELQGKDIMIASCAPAIGRTVAEMVLGEMIIGLRRIIPNAQSNRTERRAPVPNKLYLAAATIGIIGASQVGRYFLQLVRPFGPRVLLYDPYITHEAAAELGAAKVDSLLELCAQCDAITMHTPMTESTRHMMGAKEFQTMKDDAVFINSSRGGCIDEQALIAELQKGRLFAFLDVSDPEPADMDNPIRTLPNVIYTSHLAGGQSYHIGNQVVEDLKAYLSGQKPKMVVTWDMLDRLA
ncbi:Glycerate dehydrogenase [Paenibacillus solanacearum]|uniref:Glycerate dehydrogenase n=1 Tax=Paenibacillus solanacearum TaxID=2048548 RepID=A0A916K287_9BACL|nr:hydroxyacid dehydrogenase [Paenibacillus solanacearum]CAG7619714.1 Glycerate dehydrogenase [Paenibacillus solanacearum]